MASFTPKSLMRRTEIGLDSGDVLEHDFGDVVCRIQPDRLRVGSIIQRGSMFMSTRMADVRMSSSGLVLWALIAGFGTLHPRLALAQADEEGPAYCWNAIARLVPTYIQASSWSAVRRKFQSVVCDDRHSDTRGALKLALPIPGLGEIGLGLGGSEEKRQSACTKRDEFLDARALASFVGQTANPQVVAAMDVCARLERARNDAFVVSETVAGESTIVVSVRRIVPGEQQITQFTPFDAGTTCTYSAPLPSVLKSGEVWSAKCPRRPDLHFGAIVTTSIGGALSLVAPTRTFTLRTVTAGEASREAGWSDWACRRTCNAHNRIACEETVRLENKEPTVHLDHPIESRCAPSNFARCMHYASRVAPPVVSMDRQLVTQRWRLRSKPASVCIRAMRYLPGAPPRTETQIVRVGPTWTTLDIRGQQVLIDSDGVEYSIDDPMFERNGSQIRLRSHVRADALPPASPARQPS